MDLRTSLQLVDYTKAPGHERLNPHKCVISNSVQDYVCHTIFVISSSDYFYALYHNTEEQCEIEPGQLVPRIRVEFSNRLIEQYIHFAYFHEMQITEENVGELLKFAAYLNSSEMLSMVEKFLCEIVYPQAGTEEALKENLQVAEQYGLEQFKLKLIDKISDLKV